MTQPDVGPSRRLYGMLQHLLISAAHGGQHPSSDEQRNVVNQEDALDAVIQLAAAVDQVDQAGLIPPERAAFMGATLMVIRDYIKPLPQGIADDGVTDRATTDLVELVSALRAGEEFLRDPGQSHN